MGLAWNADVSTAERQALTNALAAFHTAYVASWGPPPEGWDSSEAIWPYGAAGFNEHYETSAPYLAWRAAHHHVSSGGFLSGIGDALKSVAKLEEKAVKATITAPLTIDKAVTGKIVTKVGGAKAEQIRQGLGKAGAGILIGSFAVPGAATFTGAGSALVGSPAGQGVRIMNPTDLFGTNSDDGNSWLDAIGQGLQTAEGLYTTLHGGATTSPASKAVQGPTQSGATVDQFKGIGMIAIVAVIAALAFGVKGRG